MHLAKKHTGKEGERTLKTSIVGLHQLTIVNADGKEDKGFDDRNDQNDPADVRAAFLFDLFKCSK